MKYILYCRKSTDTEDKQVLSLDSQKNELTRLAEREGIKIVDTLTESRSAKEPGRPVFNEMLKRISAGEADAILCWKIDRLTRNPVDGGQIQWLLQKGLIKIIQTFERSYSPSDNVLLMSIEQAMATQYIRDLSSNVKRGNRARLEKGGWPAPAPFGYKNNRLDKTIVIDPSRAPYLRRTFELYATGAYSLLEISNLLYAEGLRTNTGKKVMRHTLHHFLNNKFYVGLMFRQDRLYPGNHTPLISQTLFDRAQDVLHGRHHAKLEKHFYVARGFLTCASCGCTITADTKKGYHYYYCTNGRGECEEHRRYLRSEKVDGLLSDLFQELHFKDEIIEISGEAYKELSAGSLGTDQYALHARERLENELIALDTSESLLTDEMAAQVLSRDLYKEKMRQVAERRVVLKNQLAQMGSKGIQPVATFEQTRDVFLEGKRSAESYLSLSPEKKREVLGTVLSNASLQSGNVAQYLFKSPYDILARTPKNADILTMCAGKDSNLRRAMPDRFTACCN